MKKTAKITSVLLLFISQCSENSTAPSAAPTLPPLSTFLMDFSDFQGEDRLLKASPHQNWGWAALNIAFWNSVVVLNSVVPVAAFAEALNQKPARQPDNSWVWSYGFEVAGSNYTAALTARSEKDGIRWNMNISKQGGFSNYLWYTGWSNLPLTEGYWLLYSLPSDPAPLIGIDWHRQPGDSTWDLRYTNVVPDGPENGSYIHMEVRQSNPYDAFYEIYRVSLDNLIRIEWDRDAGAGRVKDEMHYQDSDWHCWDNDLNDTSCPGAWSGRFGRRAS